MKRTVKDADYAYVLTGNDITPCATNVAANGNINLQAVDNLLIMAGVDSVDYKSTATAMHKSNIESVVLTQLHSE